MPRCALRSSRAKNVRGATYPNPPVGAVILDRDGEVVGVGGTKPAGGPHAEIVALRLGAGELAQGRHRSHHAGAAQPSRARHRRAWTPFSPRAFRGSCTRSAIPTARRGRERNGFPAGVEVVGGEQADVVAPTTVARVAAQAAHRPAACDVEVRRQRRRARRRGGRHQPMDHGTRGSRGRAPPQGRAADAIVVGTGTVLTDDPGTDRPVALWHAWPTVSRCA